MFGRRMWIRLIPDLHREARLLQFIAEFAADREGIHRIEFCPANGLVQMKINFFFIRQPTNTVISKPPKGSMIFTVR